MLRERTVLTARCDASSALCRNITDATSQTYSTTSLDVGNTLRVVVTATNANGLGASISHQSATIRSTSSVQVSLNASISVVNYGRSVTLTGTVAGSSGDTVTILARPGLARSLSEGGSGLIRGVTSLVGDGRQLVRRDLKAGRQSVRVVFREHLKI